MQLIHILLCLVYGTILTHDTIVHVSALKHTKMPLLVALLDSELQEVASIMAHDLQFSGQFAVTVEHFKIKPHKKNLVKLFDNNYSLVIFLKKNRQKKTIEWRLYDTMTAHMIAGKEYGNRSFNPRVWAHAIADSVWPVLTGQKSSFSSKIAYCKQGMAKKGSPVKHIYIADFDGSNAHLLVELDRVLIAPRWNADRANPLLFYSEYTPTNVRLMSIDRYKKCRIASDFDGINMLPHFSADGKDVVYCASKGSGGCQIYYYKNGIITQLTHNEGNNFAPIFGHDNAHIYFCSDVNGKIPQIYSYTIANGHMVQVTHGNYCVSPSYCAQKNQLVYTRLTDGIMQIFIYDRANNSHIQVTQDQGNKEDCTWSACGNYILFCLVTRKGSRLVMLNTMTQERTYITPEDDICSYPACSPCYYEFFG